MALITCTPSRIAELQAGHIMSTALPAQAAACQQPGRELPNCCPWTAGGLPSAAARQVEPSFQSLLLGLLIISTQAVGTQFAEALCFLPSFLQLASSHSGQATWAYWRESALTNSSRQAAGAQPSRIESKQLPVQQTQTGSWGPPSRSAQPQ